MKREFGYVGIFLVLSLMIFINHMIKIDYNLNLIDYFRLSSDFTEEERAILGKYGTLTYGGNITEPPLGKYYEDTGQYLGLVTDLIYAMAIELEIDIVTQPLVWDDALEALKKGDIDLCDLTPSPDRSKDYLFTDSVYDLNGVAVIESSYSNQIKTIADLEGVLTGVQKGDYIIESLTEQDIHPSYVLTDNLTSAMKLLETGEVQAIIGDEPVIKNHLGDARNMDRFEILSDKIYESYVVIGMPKTHSDLRPVINKAIFRMKKSGVLQKIQVKWLGIDTAGDSRRISRKLESVVAFITALFLLALYIIYVWNRNLKKLVDDRTYELRHITEELEIILDNIKSAILLIDEHGEIRKLKGDLLPLDVDTVLSEGCHFSDSSFFTALDYKYQELYKTQLAKTEHPETFYFNYYNRIYQCYVTPLDYKSPLTLIILADETLERIQKSKIFQSNKMAAVGRLAAGIAHELRNPLGTIRNSTFILKDMEKIDEEEKIAIEVIERSTSRASKIIESLLKYSRLNETSDSYFNLHDLMSEVTNYYKKSPENRQVTFISEIYHDLYIKSNEMAIRHIITNLIGNGIEAMDRSGLMHVTANLDQSIVEIKIGDNGTGINSEDLEKIFDPFYTTKPVGQGTGLGLYIVYSQVEKLGGTIRVESQKEVGSTFIVSFPIMG